MHAHKARTSDTSKNIGMCSYVHVKLQQSHEATGTVPQRTGTTTLFVGKTQPVE